MQAINYFFWIRSIREGLACINGDYNIEGRQITIKTWAKIHYESLYSE